MQANPMLCRVFSYSFPGFPKPTNSHIALSSSQIHGNLITKEQKKYTHRSRFRKIVDQKCEGVYSDFPVYGQDFSVKMIELASKKMPGAHLYQGDFTKGLKKPLLNRSYDFIVATYSLHHLTDKQKIAFLRTLRGCLKENGRILIGDVAFETRAELEACREAAGADWDEDEIYFVASELREKLPGLTFARISPCAGVLTLARTEE